MFTILYADDTCVLLRGTDLSKLIKLINSELNLLSTWFKSNKLSLNTGKTFYMVFHRARLKPNNNNDIIMDGNILTYQSIFNLPIHIPNEVIMNFFEHNYPHVVTRSNVIMARIPAPGNTLSPYFSGDRIIYAKEGFWPVLPKLLRIDGEPCKLWHKNQEIHCKRCESHEHRTIDYDNCPLYVQNPDSYVFKSNDDPLSNFYSCKLSVFDHEWSSVEHPYQWAKMMSIGNNTLADEIVRSTSAKQAKSIANRVPFYELDDWNSKKITVMKDILFAKWTACAPFRRALLNTRGLHIIEGTIDPYWGAGVSPDIAATMHSDHLKGRNVLGTLLVELREAMTAENPTPIANVTPTPTNPPMDQSAAKTFTPAASSEAPMDQTNSQPDFPTTANSLEQPISQSAPSATETTNPPLDPESVNSTTHAAPTPNPSALEPVTTQTASSVNRAPDDPPLVSAPPQIVPLTRETVADSSIESTITDFVPQTESLPADQPKDPTSPSPNSMISAPPDGGSDKDTAITPQEGAHPSTPNTPPRLNITQTIDPTDTPTRTFRKPRRPSVHPRCERSSSMPPRPDVLSKLQTIDDMFAKELLKKRKLSPKSSTTPSMEKRAQLDEVIK